MELNQIKLYGKVIDLEVGDMFWSNGGGSVYYQPKRKNINLIPRGNDRWHRNRYVSCQKYEKEIRLADNLKKIENKPGHYLTEWVVEYVYKQDRPKYDDLIFMTIGEFYNPDIRDRSLHFEVKEINVERITEKLIFVKPHLPVVYLSRVEKTTLLKPMFHWDVMYGMSMPDDYDKLEKLMFDSYATHLQSKIIELQETLKKTQRESEHFQILRIEHGHLPTKPKRTK